MPEERGSIYKSTANEIGEALKAKLGGEGFAPKDWSENLNLLGIASEDTEAAINSLKESEGSGERGSILLSTANAIGAMLNKKYNSSRGFSPAEWASATRKMKALETDTKSGGIVNLKGAKEVPITSLVGTINPTLEGVSSVDVVATGKNLFDKSAVSPNTWIIVNSTETEPTVSYLTSDYIPVKANTKYYVSTKSSNRSAYYDQNKNGIAYFSFSGGASFTSLYDGYIRITINNTIDLNTFIVNEGDEAIAYEPFGTTYTANLGRTVYGGSGDIVKGEGEELVKKKTISSFNGTYGAVNNGYAYYISDADTTHNTSVVNPIMMIANQLFTYGDVSRGNAPTWQYGGNDGNNQTHTFILPSEYDTLTKANNFLASLETPLEVTLTLAVPVDFTFDPIPINTSGDTENFYTSHGDTAITYYEPPTAYTRGTASGGIASFSGANTEFPLTKLKATIAPSVEGVSVVKAYDEGKNLVDGTQITQDGENRVILASNIFLTAGTYNLSLSTVGTVASFYIKEHTASSSWSNVGGYSKTSINVVISENGYYDFSYYISTGVSADDLSNIQLEVGSSATQYEPYKTPTVYTADLGETVYGGSVDFVSGEKVKNANSYDLGNLTWYADSNREGVFYTGLIDNATYSNCALVSEVYTVDNTKNANTIGNMEMSSANSYGSNRIFIKNINFVGYTGAQVKTALEGVKATLALETPTESSIDPQEIYPREGVNNIWNDANGDTEVTYFEEE